MDEGLVLTPGDFEDFVLTPAVNNAVYMLTEAMPVNPPKCRICGSAHWLRDPHVFSGESAHQLSAAQPRPAQVLARSPAIIRGSELPKRSGVKEPMGPKFGTLMVEDIKPDRKAYMRAYMAKRRAEAKK